MDRHGPSRQVAESKSGDQKNFSTEHRPKRNHANTLFIATHAKTLIGAGAIRRQAAPKRGLRKGRITHPTTASPNPAKAARTSFRISYICWQLISEPIPTPLPDISRHIVKPQFIRLFAADRFGLIVILLYGRPEPDSR